MAKKTKTPAKTGGLKGRELGRYTGAANRALAKAKTPEARARVARMWARATGKTNSKQDMANIRTGKYKLSASGKNG